VKTSVRLGAYFLPTGFHTFLESVRVADSSGYARAWITDAHTIWTDPYVYITQRLAATGQLVFGTAVTNAVTRHITIAASTHATLAKTHPGRVVLGLRRGEYFSRTLALRALGVSEMRDAARDVRAVLAGRAVECNGASVRLTWADEDVPLMMAGTGPRSLRLAGAMADMVTVEVEASLPAVSWAVDNIRQGAQEVGRDPDTVQIIVLCAMWMSEDVTRSESELSVGQAWTGPTTTTAATAEMRRRMRSGYPTRSSTGLPSSATPATFSIACANLLGSASTK
jgi:5,10-methylenetetrahydromethanopterin reductase